MDPILVGLTAEEYRRVVRLIDSAMPTLGALPGTLQWRSDAGELCEQRLREAISLIEQLRDGYDQAGGAVADYVEAQDAAKLHVAAGFGAEVELRTLLSRNGLIPGGLRASMDPMLLWDDLRATIGTDDALYENAVREQIEQVRATAEDLYGTASDAYRQAISVEAEARQTAAQALTAAYEMLPNFRAGSIWTNMAAVFGGSPAEEIIEGTPGLAGETAQATSDPNTRRPSLAVVAAYQVTDQSQRVTYPDGWLTPAGWIFGSEEVQASEAAILHELSPTEQIRFRELRDEAFAAGEERFPAGEGDDNHQDAFRHAYWNALMTSQHGPEWTERFANAHESVAGNPALRETMDLYNNNIGRTIAMAHPNASQEELAALVEAAVRQGHTTVVGADGQLHYSDQVSPDETGHPAETPAPGRLPVPEAEY